MTLDPDPLRPPDDFGSQVGPYNPTGAFFPDRPSRSPAVLSLVFAALSGFCLGIVVGLVAW